MKRKGWPLLVDDRDIVRSAGGIVTRIIENRLQFLIIHRTRHKDWSFPKGRLEPGETPETGALREVREETFCSCALDRTLPTARYMDRNGHPKEVRFWMMTVISEEPFMPNQEIDEIQWLSYLNTFEKLSYKTDRILLKLAFA